MPRRVFLLALGLILLVACQTQREDARPAPEPGPPSFRAEEALRHAEQFEGDDLRVRPAGSEAEQAAAAYLVGVLGSHGYAVRLDAVPVGNLVRSTNVIGQPAQAGDPEVVVVVTYDTPNGETQDPRPLGIFLELSRALNVAEPAHRVWFVAVGAAATGSDEGPLGPRRLARFLLDEGHDPFVVEIVPGGESGVRVAGDRVEEILGADDGHLDPDLRAGDPDVFGAAGFDSALIGGEVEDVGEALLGFLARAGD